MLSYQYYVVPFQERATTSSSAAQQTRNQSQTVEMIDSLLHGRDLVIHPTLESRGAPPRLDFYLTPSNPIILRSEVPKGLRCVVHLGVLETHLYGLRLLALQVSEVEKKCFKKSSSEHAISLLFLTPEDSERVLQEIETELDIGIQVIPADLLPT